MSGGDPQNLHVSPDKEQVEHEIDRRADHDGIQRQRTVPEATQNGAVDVVKSEERHAAQDDPQVDRGVSENVLRGAEQCKNRIRRAAARDGEQQDGCGQDDRECIKESEARYTRYHHCDQSARTVLKKIPWQGGANPAGSTPLGLSNEFHR